MSVDLATELREYTKLDYKGNNCYKIRARLIRQLKEGKDVEKDNILDSERTGNGLYLKPAFLSNMAFKVNYKEINRALETDDKVQDYQAVELKVQPKYATVKAIIKGETKEDQRAINSIKTYEKYNVGFNSNFDRGNSLLKLEFFDKSVNENDKDLDDRVLFAIYLVPVKENLISQSKVGFFKYIKTMEFVFAMRVDFSLVSEKVENSDGIIYKTELKAVKDINQQKNKDKELEKDMTGLDIYEGSQNPEETLNSLIGLGEVKTQIETFKNRIMFQNKMKQLGNDQLTSGFNNHMIFYGEPGTGKTTVARIIAGLLYKLGITRKNRCVQVNGESLKAEYVGQTAPKVQKVIDAAVGGVLFIDEAYALNDVHYGKEAVNVLLQNMEDKKDDLVIILAGYESDMKNLMNVNPGLKSRIGYWIKFESYNANELLDIFKFSLKKKGLGLSSDCEKPLLYVLDQYHKMGKTTGVAGNARFINKMVNDIIDNHAKNCMSGVIPESGFMDIQIVDLKDYMQ